jgi:DNA-binding CsgD family transcriptional regulator
LKPISAALPAPARPSQSRNAGESPVDHGALALAWLDHDYTPRCVLADDLSVLWANIAARSALARRRDLEVRDGALYATKPQHQGELLAFLRSSGAGISTLCLPRSSGKGHLLLRAQRLSWSEEPAYGVSFFGTGEDYVHRYADLDVAFGLTQAENKVLLRLLDGHDVEQLAQLLEVSVETVRSHVRKIYQKIGVRSREALFRAARPFSV